MSRVLAWVETMLIVFLVALVTLLLDGDEGGRDAPPQPPSESPDPDHLEGEPVVVR